MNRLNKVLAIERAIKPGIYARFTELHKATQRAGAMDGFEKTYRPAKEDDSNSASSSKTQARQFPPESKKAEFSAWEVFEEVSKSLSELFDCTATKDWANCSAKGDVIVDGVTLLTQVPAAHILFLDKQLSDIRKFISSIVELDPAIEWNKDPNTNLYKAAPTESIKTEKILEPLTLAPATDKHPAQVQVQNKDSIVGFWTTIKYSGALSPAHKKELLVRVQKLINAVKGALEQANMVEAPTQDVGSKIFGFLFKSIP